MTRFNALWIQPNQSYSTSWCHTRITSSPARSSSARRLGRLKWYRCRGTSRWSQCRPKSRACQPSAVRHGHYEGPARHQHLGEVGQRSGRVSEVLQAVPEGDAAERRAGSQVVEGAPDLQAGRRDPIVHLGAEDGPARLPRLQQEASIAAADVHQRARLHSPGGLLDDPHATPRAVSPRDPVPAAVVPLAVVRLQVLGFRHGHAELALQAADDANASPDCGSRTPGRATRMVPRQTGQIMSPRHPPDLKARPRAAPTTTAADPKGRSRIRRWPAHHLPRRLRASPGLDEGTREHGQQPYRPVHAAAHHDVPPATERRVQAQDRRRPLRHTSGTPSDPRTTPALRPRPAGG